MKRTFVMLLVCLVLGAVVNVGVAWWIALRVHTADSCELEEIRYSDAPRKGPFLVLVNRAFGSEQLYGRDSGLYLNVRFGQVDVAPMSRAWPQWSEIRTRTHAQFIDDFSSRTSLVSEEARGWPFYCLRWEHRMRPVPNSHALTFGNIAGGIDLGGGTRAMWFPRRTDHVFQPSMPPELREHMRVGFPQELKVSKLVLPYMPIWSGFAVNTMVYAATLWLLFAFPFTLRRWNRKRRGRCPACAYPVGTSPICTECGKPVRARTTLHASEPRP